MYSSSILLIFPKWWLSPLPPSVVLPDSNNFSLTVALWTRKWLLPDAYLFATYSNALIHQSLFYVVRSARCISRFIIISINVCRYICCKKLSRVFWYANLVVARHPFQAFASSHYCVDSGTLAASSVHTVDTCHCISFPFVVSGRENSSVDYLEFFVERLMFRRVMLPPHHHFIH